MTSSTLLDTLKSLISSPDAWPMQAVLKPDAVAGDASYTGLPIIARQDYFSISLVRMRLQAGQQYWVKFVPLVMAYAEYLFNGKFIKVPAITSDKLANAFDTDLSKHAIDIGNLPLFGPTPYTGGPVELFTGLFAISSNNLSNAWFKVVGDLIGTFDLGQVSMYLRMAEKLESGLRGVLSLDDIRFKLGVLRTFIDDDPNRFCDCYIAYVSNTDGPIDTKALRVQNDDLWLASPGSGCDPLSGCDYCLIRVRRQESRSDFSQFPFYRLYEAAVQKTWAGNIDDARMSMSRLYEDMAACPDLTNRHRLQLIQLFTANLEAERFAYEATRGAEGRGDGCANRGAADRDPVVALKGVAARMWEAAEAQPFARGLFNIADAWNGIPHLARSSEGFKLTDDVLNKQLEAIKDLSPPIDELDPIVISKAFALGFNTYWHNQSRT